MNGPVISEITLEVSRLHASMVCADEYEFAGEPRLEKEYNLYVGRHLLHLTQEVLTQKELVTKYPANWVEALKERFAPAWFLARWPVGYVTINMEVLYPKIALPKDRHVVRMYKCGPIDLSRSYFQ